MVSILHRLPPINEGQKPVLHEVQPDLHPLEILFDVSKLLDPDNVRGITRKIQSFTFTNLISRSNLSLRLL